MVQTCHTTDSVQSNVSSYFEEKQNSHLQNIIRAHLGLVISVEHGLTADPLGHDEVQRRFAFRTGHRTQEVDHSQKLGLDELRVHEEQALKRQRHLKG